jgi:hypothetical protein
MRGWCSEIFWVMSLNLVTEFPYRSLQVMKTFAGKQSAHFKKSENLTESQARLVFGKFLCKPTKKAPPALGDFLRISLNYHAYQNPNHQLPEKVMAVAPKVETKPQKILEN